ncbi:reverse transcriptase [Abeliophyllum distichum]|uniref:Reverse transcriptase n=1 Tax=Abeliophyllum distichum TaxID=126358 RepID=A0ABD1REC7_9LAMI
MGKGRIVALKFFEVDHVPTEMNIRKDTPSPSSDDNEAPPSKKPRVQEESGEPGTSVFSKIDLRSVYHELRSKPTDIPKMMFQTHYGHYESTVIPFGLTNAPMIFMELMNPVFQHYPDRFVIVFIYDTLLYSRNPQQYEEDFKTVLETVCVEKLYAKFKKCEFWLD